MSIQTETEVPITLKPKSPDLTHKTPASEAPVMTKKKGPSAETRKKVGIGLGAILLVLSGYFFYNQYMYVGTDNAYVQASSTLLSSKVSGIITKANVVENQKVKAGDVLVEIKSDDYDFAAAQSKSDMDALEAQVRGARLHYTRISDLYGKGAATKERLDSAEAQFKSLESKWKATQAQYNQAKLNLDYTRIVAPADGKIAKKAFEVGMLANVGQPLLGFVAGNERWVDANFKETDLVGISEGKKAYITVDAIPGKEFEGVVESISPATGATFSLLPPDNATGNFTKVVQRVPVRIKLLNLTEAETDRLQAGLSAEVKIKVH
jgi:membrane fusion protein (multidrug efflux system)